MRHNNGPGKELRGSLDRRVVMMRTTRKDVRVGICKCQYGLRAGEFKDEGTDKRKEKIRVIGDSQSDWEYLLLQRS
jgi:hypothetical protein